MTAIRFALIFVLIFLPTGPFATTFPVTKTADTNGSCTPGNCSLREAIDAANTNPGADDVPVPAGTYLLTLGRLTVTEDVSIAGADQTTTIIDGNASSSVFGIPSGVVAEISGVAIQNGRNDYNGGGGIVNFYGTLTLTNSTVRDNFSAGVYGGGGILNSGGTITLTNSTVSDNISVASCASFFCYGGSGGGIMNYYGTITLINSTVSGSDATYVGGISSNVGTITLTNSTVSGNSGESAGGIRGSGVTLTNTIVADNSADNTGTNCESPINSLGYNLTDDTSCGFTEPTDLVVADAMLGPLQDNGGPTETHDLLPGSPAIDAGSMDCPPPATDQRGVARPQGTDCDIGAVEFAPEPGSSVTLIAGAAFLGLLYRRRAR